MSSLINLDTGELVDVGRSGVALAGRFVTYNAHRHVVIKGPPVVVMESYGLGDLVGDGHLTDCESRIGPEAMLAAFRVLKYAADVFQAIDVSLVTGRSPDTWTLMRASRVGIACPFFSLLQVTTDPQGIEWSLEFIFRPKTSILYVMAASRADGIWISSRSAARLEVTRRPMREVTRTAMPVAGAIDVAMKHWNGLVSKHVAGELGGGSMVGREMKSYEAMLKVIAVLEALPRKEE